MLIAENRAARPNDFNASSAADAPTLREEACPFCAGNEHLTPEQLHATVGPDGQWQVRVVPNKFPAVSLEPDIRLHSQAKLLDSVSQSPVGAHEVILESPRHVQDITDLSCEEWMSVLQVYRDRLRYWAADGRLRHATIFKNVGSAAGASLEHVHSQLIVLPTTPPAVEQELECSGRYYDSHQACLFCRLIDDELEHQQRVVISDGPYLACCAYAARQPYETWILPREHVCGFEQVSDQALEPLAKTIQQLVLQLQTQLKPLAYNLMLHTAPFGQQHVNAYHWHFELVPRTTQLAGFEWSSGMHINPLAPERAASRLRSAQIS